MCVGGGQRTASTGNVPGEGPKGNLEIMAPDTSTFVGTKPNSGCTGVQLPDCTPEASGSTKFTQATTANQARGLMGDGVLSTTTVLYICTLTDKAGTDVKVTIFFDSRILKRDQGCFNGSNQ